jgi:hypothetical protein
MGLAANKLPDVGAVRISLHQLLTAAAQGRADQAAANAL